MVWSESYISVVGYFKNLFSKMGNANTDLGTPELVLSMSPDNSNDYSGTEFSNFKTLDNISILCWPNETIKNPCLEVNLNIHFEGLLTDF